MERAFQYSLCKVLYLAINPNPILSVLAPSVLAMEYRMAIPADLSSNKRYGHRQLVLPQTTLLSHVGHRLMLLDSPSGLPPCISLQYRLKHVLPIRRVSTAFAHIRAYLVALLPTTG